MEEPIPSVCKARPDDSWHCSARRAALMGRHRWAHTILAKHGRCDRWAGVQVADTPGVKRTHVRNYFPLYTKTTLWDNADHRALSSLYIHPMTCASSPRPRACVQPNPHRISNNSVVFADDFRKWESEFHPHVPGNISYDLLTQNGDVGVCNTTLRSLLAAPNVRRIYSHNACRHPKLWPVPLGLQDNLEPEMMHVFNGNVSAFLGLLTSVLASRKVNWVYANFQVGTNAGARGPLASLLQRTEWRGLVSARGRCAGAARSNHGALSIDAYWRDLGMHRFALAPAGNGRDCHRLWEALLVGTIPIVLKKQQENDLHAGLPILVVENWTDLSMSLLNATWHAYNARGGWLFAKLFAPYWIDLLGRDSARCHAL